MSRADARRQLREDERFVARGLDAGQLDASQVVALMRVLRDRLRACIERRSITSLMAFLYSNVEAGSKHIADVPIACRRGCSYCCNIWVDATAPEVFYAAKALNGAGKRTAIEAVNGALALTEGRTFDDRGDMVTPCPLLRDNLCGVYPARPINCRTAVSADADICRRSYLEISGEDIPTPMVWMALRQGYGIALEGALVNAGLVPDAREWNACLNIALVDPGAEARWLAGDDVFAVAPRASGPPLTDHPMFRALYREAFG